ncbi:FKBP-type peptidyl-prolyl cis-trans isomerase domain [Trinorchestia longiramus]|nr:FKBP-type peptidyl-prolyl cis-trans isomerase domain [Trinorchestia longiramus]
MSFWSLILEPGKKYEKEVENGIQVTRATLDTSQASGNDGIVQIILDYEGKEMTVANLSVKHGIFQTTLDLTFKEGDKVAFTTSGAKLPVSLTGIAGLEDDDEDDEMDEEDYENMAEDNTVWTDDDSEEDAPELVSGSKKRKLEVAEKFRRPAKSAKLANGTQKPLTLNGESFLSDDDDDDSYNPTADLSSMGEELLGEEEELDDQDLDSDDEDDDLDEEEEEEDEDAEEEEEEEEEDDEDEEEEEVSPVQKKKGSNLNGVMDSPKQKKKEQSAAGVKENTKQAEAQKPAKKDQKTPAKEGKTPKKSPSKTSEAKTPSQDKAKSPKENKAVKALKAEGKETPKSEKKKLKEAKGTPQQKQETGSPKKQMRAGGVVVEDVSLGTGEAAKKGSNVSMYYVGRLKSNNKVFDSQLSGPPLKFVLGRGEVISGWDIGLVGMKVGGKRKLSIPSGMAYGKKGAPPEIPPQANLEFEVTMISCR